MIISPEESYRLKGLLAQLADGADFILILADSEVLVRGRPIIERERNVISNLTQSNAAKLLQDIGDALEPDEL